MSKFVNNATGPRWFYTKKINFINQRILKVIYMNIKSISSKNEEKEEKMKNKLNCVKIWAYCPKMADLRCVTLMIDR